MPNGKKPAGKGGAGLVDQGRWILLFLIIVVVIFVSARSGFGPSGERGIRFGSPSASEEVSEEGTPIRPLPEPAPLPAVTGKKAEVKGESSFGDKVTLYQGQALLTEPDREYLQLQTSPANKEKIVITGWTLKNSKGVEVKIKGASYLPFSGRVNPEENIALGPGERVFLITGSSPLGANFRTNLCTGYFSQNKNFEPALARDCPRPEDEPGAEDLSTSCVNFLRTIPLCRQPLTLPLEPECNDYASSKINYKTCVDSHKKDENFYRKEWYVYFDRTSELWKDRNEKITLRDASGKIITVLSY